MSYLNKVLLMGNLTRKPELRHTTSETPVCHTGLAMNRVHRDGDGEQRKEATFVDIEAWGRQAETIARYLDKGSPVFIEGRLQLDRWEDEKGERRSKHKIIVESFQFIDGKKHSNTDA